MSHLFPGGNWGSSPINLWDGRAKKPQHSPFWHTTFSSGLHPAQDQTPSELHDYSQLFFFFFSWISGGPWDESSHEVVEIYPVRALCQPPWGWAGCDLSLRLFKASYGRKNVLPYTWWEGNVVFARWAYRYGLHVWNYGNFFLLTSNKLWFI